MYKTFTYHCSYDSYKFQSITLFKTCYHITQNTKALFSSAGWEVWIATTTRNIRHMQPLSRSTFMPGYHSPYGESLSQHITHYLRVGIKIMRRFPASLFNTFSNLS